MSMEQLFWVFFVFAVGKCLREGLMTISDAFLSHDREALALN